MKATAIIRRIIVSVLLMVLVLEPSAHQSDTHAAGPWYVKPGGNDGNSCQSTTEACATINGAIAKADASDTIYIAEGTYTSAGMAVVLLDKNVNLSGGWDLDFVSHDSLSIIDAQYERRGMIISANVTTSIEKVDITHGVGQSSGGGGGIMIGNNATVTLTDSVIQEIQSYGAISASLANLTLVRTTIRHSIDQGILNYLGTLKMVSSAIVGNTYGIVSNGETFIENSTISGNTHGGIAMDCSGSINISSSTITENHDFGLRTYWCNSAVMQNTILAGNVGTVYQDCTGPLSSNGYNIIGNMAGCGFVSTTGDLTNVDPKLWPLQDNGGSTQTYALLNSSPAIDGGNPDGCKDSGGILLENDQRGSPRNGRCDIGAYERQPEISWPNVLYLPIASRACPAMLFSDDFSDPNSGWPVFENEDVRYEYLNSEYRILLKSPEMWAGARSGFQASDYVAVVDVRNATGDPGSYGMIFGLSDDWTQFYVFEIDGDGVYEIWRVVDLYTWRLLAMGFSRFIHPGAATNQLKIQRNGDLIWAYANGQLLKVTEDGNYTEPRSVGLITITSLTQSNVDTRFDNFTIYPITCGASRPTLSKQSGRVDREGLEFNRLKKWGNYFTHSLNRK